MDTAVWIVIAVVVVLAVLAAILLAQRRRSTGLQERFGGEYQRTVARRGDQRAAEAELTSREKRRRELNIVALDPGAQDRYRQEWRTTQSRFVDDPAGATHQADGLVERVMRDRGYPVDDFEQQAADVSVDHPQVAENYRAAHAISRLNEEGLASTDDLRQAFVHYRSLFAQLLDVDGDVPKEARQ